MTEEERETIQINIRVYKDQLNKLDKYVKDSKHKSRSELMRKMIDNYNEKRHTLDETKKILNDSEEMFKRLEKVEELTKLINWEEIDIKDPEIEKKLNKQLNQEERGWDG